MKKQQKKKTKSKQSFIGKMKVKITRFMKDDMREAFSLFEVVVIILFAILFGILIGYVITYNRNTKNTSQSHLSEVVSTYNNIVNRYYKDVDQEALSSAAIKGMIESLGDTYSDFMDAQDTSDFGEIIDGSFVGIGVQVLFEEGHNRIVSVYENSPAQKAGLKKDDIILSIDGKDVEGIVGDEFVSLVRGKEGTSLTLEIQRGEKKKELVVKRGRIELEIVSSDILSYENKKIGYMKISSFSANSYTQFETKLKKIKKAGIDYLIIDVRDNLGGHLLQTKQILSLFFDKKTVLYQTEVKGKKTKYYSDHKAIFSSPVAVLIDGSSASASELLASCFQENYPKGIIVGIPSYGKGTVQKTHILSDGSSVKYTTQKWLTAKGKWIDGTGVIPDIEVHQAEQYYLDPSYELDNQLQVAIKELVKAD